MRAALAIAAVLAAGCEREARRFEAPAASEVALQAPAMVTLHPGQTPPRQDRDRPRAPRLQDNAWAIAEGGQLYQAFNCVGCHAMGGGGMGPALRDAPWIYGSAPEEVFATIVEGRPNGMPSFRNKIAPHDVWKLVAYVRSMSGLTRGDSVAARTDDLRAVPPTPIVPDEVPVAAPPTTDAGVPR